MIPLKDTIRSRHLPVMTWMIVGANVLVFIFQLSLSNAQLQAFVNNFALVPATWQTQPMWFAVTIFTSMFMHSGWIHIISNLWTLLIFGDNVEDRMGPFGFLGFYLFSGISAGLLQVLIDPSSTIPTLGASGAIAGVMGAYLVLYPRARVVTLIPLFIFFTTINIPAVLYLGFWFFSQFFSGLSVLGNVSVGGVAWWAHIGGFLFGVLMVRRFLFRDLPVLENVYPTYSQDIDYRDRY